MISDVLIISFLLAAACFIFYHGCKLETKRQRKINALYDEMYIYFKNENERMIYFDKSITKDKSC